MEPRAATELGFVAGGPADELPALDPSPERAPDPWKLTLYAGQYIDSRFVEILGFQGGDLLGSYLGGFALSKELDITRGALTWELEGSSFTHWGVQDHVEINAAVLARWNLFPWDRWIDTSLAFGQGVSWASNRPEFEGETRRILHHLLTEVAVRPVRSWPVDLVLRVHHRSGAFYAYGVKGGANFLLLGLRFQP